MEDVEQTIDLRESGKSRYFVITEFENCSKNSITKFVFIFQNHYLTAQGAIFHFSHESTELKRVE